MTLEQLRIFVAVAEREHVTEAAKALNLTPSAVSAAITTLEGRYQTPFFDRIGRRIALSDAGKLFLIEARGVLARAAAAEAMLGELAGLERGRLALGASQTVAGYWLPRHMQAYQQRHPGIATSLRIGNTDGVAAWVCEGIIGLGIVEGPVTDNALRSEIVAEDEMVLVVAPGHAWARRRKVAPTDLGGTRWVVRESGSGTRAILETLARRARLPFKELDIAFELPANEAVRTAVEAGAGAAIMSRLVAAASLASGQLVALPLAMPTRHFYALHHRERSLSAAERAFLDQLRKAP